MRLATCEVLCETCNRAVANRYCQESCICDGCWDAAGQRSVSQPLGSSVTALPLCERCEQVPVAHEVAICPACQTCLKNRDVPAKMDFTASLWSASPASASTRSNPSPRVENEPLLSPEAGPRSRACIRDADLRDSISGLNEAPGKQPVGAELVMETTTQRTTETTGIKGSLPFWFPLLCEDIELRYRWMVHGRKRRHASSVDVCPSEALSIGDAARHDRPLSRQRVAEKYSPSLDPVSPNQRPA